MRRTTARLGAVTAALAILSATGCSGDAAPPTVTSPASPSASASVTTSLVGSWKGTTLVGEQGATDASPVTFTFGADGKVIGRTVCGPLSGTYTREGNNLTFHTSFEPSACVGIGPADPVDQAVNDLTQSPVVAQVSDATLELSWERGTLRLARG